MNILLFLAIFLLLTIIPGILFYIFLFGENISNDPFELIGVSIIIGLSFLSFISLFMYFFIAKLQILIFTILCISIILIIINWIKLKITGRHIFASSIQVKIFHLNGKRKYFLLFFAFLVILSMLCFIVGGNVEGLLLQDSHYFISCISNITKNNAAIPFDPYFLSKKIINQFYAYNTSFVILAFLAKFSSSSVIELWSNLPLLLTPLSALAIYFLVKIITEDIETAIFITILFFVFDLFFFSDYSWFGICRWQSMGYPNKICFYIFLPYISGFTLKYIKSGYMCNCIILLLLLFAVFFIYPGSIALSGIVIGVLFIGMFVIPPKFYTRIILLKRFFILFLIIFFSGLCFIVIRHYELKNSFIANVSNITAQFDGYNSHFYIFNKYLFLLKPKYFFMNWLNLISIPIVFFLARKKTIGTAFLWSTTLLIPLIVFLPFVAGILGNIIPWLFLERFKFLIPSAIVLGYSICLILKKYTNLNLIKVIIILLSFFLTFGLLRGIEHHDNKVIFSRKVDNILQTEIPWGSFIFSDEYSSYSLTPLTGTEIYTSLKGVNNLVIPSGLQRLDEINKLRQNKGAAKETISLAESMKAKYLFINRKYWIDNGKQFLSAGHQSIKLIYRNKDYLIFKLE